MLIEFTFLRLWQPFAMPAEEVKFLLLVTYTAVYLVLGAALLVLRRRQLRELFELAAFAARKAAGQQPVEPDRAD